MLIFVDVVSLFVFMKLLKVCIVMFVGRLLVVLIVMRCELVVSSVRNVDSVVVF